jgi:hypothetical protein
LCRSAADTLPRIGYYLPMRPAARLLALILGNQTRAAGLSR